MFRTDRLDQKTVICVTFNGYEKRIFSLSQNSTICDIKIVSPWLVGAQSVNPFFISVLEQYKVEVAVFSRHYGSLGLTYDQRKQKDLKVEILNFAQKGAYLALKILCFKPGNVQTSYEKIIICEIMLYDSHLSLFYMLLGTKLNSIIHEHSHIISTYSEILGWKLKLGSSARSLGA